MINDVVVLVTAASVVTRTGATPSLFMSCREH
jgi:hypothetical protein